MNVIEAFPFQYQKSRIGSERLDRYNVNYVVFFYVIAGKTPCLYALYLLYQAQMSVPITLVIYHYSYTPRFTNYYLSFQSQYVKPNNTTAKAMPMPFNSLRPEAPLLVDAVAEGAEAVPVPVADATVVVAALASA